MSTGYTKALAKSDFAEPLLRAFGQSDHANAIRLKEAHDAFQTGNLDALFGLMRDDVIWRMPGENALAGTYVGRDEIMRNFAMLQENVDSYWAYPLDYFGSDDHVVLVAHVKAARGDKTLDVKECMLWRVDEDGKLAEVWHMCLDEKAWDVFFTRD